MTKEELREKIEEYLYDCCSLPFHQIATNILTLTEQYYREAGYKSPHEVKSLVFNAILHADDKQIEEVMRQRGWKGPEEIEQLIDDAHDMYNDDL